MVEEIKAYLYPNPPLKDGQLTNIWGDTFIMESKPFLEVEFFNFPPGKYHIEISYPFSLRKTVVIRKPFTSTYFYHEKFYNPQLSEVEISIKNRKKKKVTAPLNVHKIYGKVKDFDGNPFPSYLWATREYDQKFKSIAKTDENGKFVFYYPQGKQLRLFIDDESYSKKTLECWVIANTLKNDIKINPRIGDFEFYDFQAWFSANSCYAFFIPASLPLLLKEKSYQWKKRIPPKLTFEDNIKLKMNYKKVRISDIIELPTYGKFSYPAYVLTSQLKNMKLSSPTIVQVEMNSNSKGRGEAWFIHYF